MTIQSQQERRALNDGIEDAYVATAWHSACIQNFYENQMGVVKESYEMFYLNFVFLVKLTECLEQLSSDKVAVKTVKAWLTSDKGKDIKAKWEAGDRVFLEYVNVLSARGLLALPSKATR